ncbi:hypothetical protein B0H13DRAFT_1859361 [Mycena leptocephala]|nr:hypothetical protein B0H13DRAFT_1859361 [Mycena leptocephala]
MDYYNPTSDSYTSDSYSDSSEDPASLVDLLANEYKLSNDFQDELHSFLEIARPLPDTQRRVGLIQQAAMLHAHHLLEETRTLGLEVREATDSILKGTAHSARLTSDQKVLLHAVEGPD